MKKHFAEKKEEKESKKSFSLSSKVAKKDWVIKHNQYYFEIKEGEELPEGIPGFLMEALKIEEVI